MYNSKIIVERIKTLVKGKNVLIKDMLSECGISKNALSSMSSGGSMPKSENLALIADYLDCSVDYLLGRTNNPIAHKLTSVVFGDISNNSGIVGNVDSTINATIPNTQIETLLNMFKSLNPIEQAKLLVYVDGIVKGKNN